MKKSLLIGLIAAMVFFLVTGDSYSGEIDLLLKKLVEKEVLTAGEAQELKIETQEQIKSEIARGKSAALPKWVQNTKINGDFRLRYQLDHTANTTNDRQRGRLRLRLGLESKVNEKIKVGVGLATGKNDGSASQNADFSRSTNQSFEDEFSKHPVSLDYAYGKYTPTPEVAFIGGKFKNVLWEPGDLIWDTDINPEGGAFLLTKKLNSETDVFLTPGLYSLDENSNDGDDPTMPFVQAGLNHAVTEKIALKGAVSYQGTTNVKGRALEGTTGTNTNTTGTTSGLLKQGYSVISPAMQLTIKEPLKGLDVPLLDVPALSFFGEYVENTLVKTRGAGFMAGFRFGAEKIANWGDWQFAYSYAMLGKDAVLDILPDSDRVGGKTGTRAHEAVVQYGLGKNNYLSIDYYQGWTIASNPVPQHVVQVDWNLKF
ncbi:MAG: putative porin [Candidatus Omnitrophota bacterium]|jgi:hypothetical protein